ncbi:MAG: DUF3805 domain-containing protein [Bacteroidales bacterium]|jgi:hypothetical protein|nr:DUF3805 domain-containing protein [Bacteroidales bacterium]
MKTNKFISKYNYSIELPKNWSEFQLDESEKNTNGFFNASEWTGNLRITPLSFDKSRLSAFFKEKLMKNDAKKIDWNNIIGISYFEQSDDVYSYYWYLIENQKLYFCSFTIDFEMKDTKKNKIEIKRIIKILQSLETTNRKKD